MEGKNLEAETSTIPRVLTPGLIGFLHDCGLTNLSDEQVDVYIREYQEREEKSKIAERELGRKILFPVVGQKAVWKYGFNSDWDRIDRNEVPLSQKILEQFAVTTVHLSAYGGLSYLAYQLYDLLK